MVEGLNGLWEEASSHSLCVGLQEALSLDVTVLKSPLVLHHLPGLGPADQCFCRSVPILPSDDRTTLWSPHVILLGAIETLFLQDALNRMMQE